MGVPTIGVVAVNYNGGALTLDCLHSVVRSDWPAAHLRVVMVDNASSDGVAERVRRELPVVQVLELPTNEGFGAGCNAGIAALGDVDLVALVNNDATVDPGWLRPLVDALDADPAVGAACPKILFAGRFVEVEVRSDTDRRGFGDGRDLGVFVAGARVDGDDVWARAQFVDGNWGLEPDAEQGGQWTGPVAHLRVPILIDRPNAVVSLLLAADGPRTEARTVTLGAGGDVTEHAVGPDPQWCDVVAAGPAVEIVNNAGTELLADGFAADRGYLEPDDGRYDEPVDVDAWCGAGVLLRRSYLDDVGLFDAGLFVYYEDVELALRGAARGWRYRYVPESVVHHVHAASTRRGSALKQYYDERNRLLVLARHGSFSATAAASVRSLLVTASYARRDVLAPLLDRRPARPDVVWRRLRSWGAYARGVPGAAALRRGDRARDARTP